MGLVVDRCRGVVFLPATGLSRSLHPACRYPESATRGGAPSANGPGPGSGPAPAASPAPVVLRFGERILSLCAELCRWMAGGSGPSPGSASLRLPGITGTDEGGLSVTNSLEVSVVVRRTTFGATFFGVVAGCTTIPDGPSVVVMPAPGKPFDLFVYEDRECRQFAQQPIGTSASQASTASAEKSIAAGTALGAVAGTLGGGQALLGVRPWG
jgi:hypothetical protein